MIKITRGEVRKREWFTCDEHGRPSKRCCRSSAKREAWGWTVSVDGKQVRRQGYASETEAQDALDAFRSETLAPPVEQKPTMTLSDAIDRFIAEKSRKKSTAEAARVLRRVWLPAFGAETPLSDITADRIAGWRAARMTDISRQTKQLVSLASVYRPLALLRAVLRMAHREWCVLDTVPFIKFEKEKERLRWLKPEEATRLLDAARDSRNADLADLIEFSLFTGLRQSEALGLSWDHVDRARGVIVLDETKNGESREVPLNARADGVLARRGSASSEGLVFGSSNWDTFRTAWETALRRAKIVNFRWHDLRHTCASWMVQAGRPLQEVKDFLGHKTLAVTLRYAHLAPENLRKAASSLDAVLPCLSTPSAHEPVTEPTSHRNIEVTA
jgi:integrase